MPAFFSHFLCGEESLKFIDKTEIKNTVDKHKNTFVLGTQGPDFFYFHRIHFWTDKGSLYYIGTLFHKEIISQFFELSLDYIMNRPDSEKEVLLAYLYGYVCHYALDTEAHPYVFYKTGFARKGEKSLKFKIYHRKFEYAIDVLMCNLLRGRAPSSINASRLMQVDASDAEIIGRMYEYILKNAANLNITWIQTADAINCMRKALSIFRDRTGIKRRLALAYEKIFKKEANLSSLIYPKKITDNPDYLNQKHAPWAMPWDNSIIRTDSFIDIFNSATGKTNEYIKAIYLYANNRLDRESVLDLLGNRSFTSGLDCRINTEFKFYDCVFENES